MRKTGCREVGGEGHLGICCRFWGVWKSENAENPEQLGGPAELCGCRGKVRGIWSTFLELWRAERAAGLREVAR